MSLSINITICVKYVFIYRYIKNTQICLYINITICVKYIFIYRYVKNTQICLYINITICVKYVFIYSNILKIHISFQLLNMGVLSSTVDVTSETARSYRFNLRRFYPGVGCHVLVGDGAFLVADDEGFAGSEEFYRFFFLVTFLLLISYFSFQPVLHDWCNKGRGMCYPVCGMVHIKEPLLLIGKSSPCASLNKTFPSFLLTVDKGYFGYWFMG